MGALDRYLDEDEVARAKISGELDATLFVEAGAGTGKTGALVDRYVALVQSGKRVEELVAITFTEKAAAELRDRIRADLEARIAEGGEVANLERARDALDRSQISTIHAFCAGVLRSFAAEHGIDPSFAVQDQIAAERRFDAEWNVYLDGLSGDEKAHAAFRRVQELGLWTRDLETLAHELWANPSLAEQLELNPLTAPAPTWPDINEILAEIHEFQLGRVGDGDRLKEYVTGLQHMLEELLAAPVDERLSRLAAISATFKEKLGIGQKGNWALAVDIERVRSEVPRLQARLVEYLAMTRSQALGDFLPYVVNFACGDSRKRACNGELIFEDLILQVRNILAASKDARRRLRGRFATMLVDEFQDTDPLQTEIALAFATDPDTEEIQHGRLFLVGDPKQSIYRFRRADMAVYSKTREDLGSAGGIEEKLSLNRRSHPRVLDFVNGVFARMVGPGLLSWLQPAYNPVHPYREGSLAGPGVGLIGGAFSERAAQGRRKEAQQLAAYCRAALDEGWQVSVRGPRSEQATRAANFGDIAILVPTRTILGPLERALAEAGIPYRIEGGSLVYATQEVRDIINCLSAIDDPTDEVAVVGALRSPAYACSDVELAQHRLSGGLFDYTYYKLDEAEGRVADGLRDLRDFHKLRSRMSIAALVEAYISGRRVVEAGMFTSGSRDAFRRARFVIEQARIFEVERPESLRAFVDWLDRRAGEAIYDSEGAGLDDDEDAVRIMTVHAAKGLEFPIVFLGGLGVSPRNQYPAYLLDRHSNEIAVNAGTKSRKNNATLGPYEAVSDQEKEHDHAERVRLLYVAATRARDHLLISLYHQEKAHNTHARAFIDGGALNHAPLLDELEPITGADAGPFAGLRVDADQRDEATFIAARAALAVEAKGRMVSSATALGRLAEDGQDEEKEREDETEPWARGRAGTHRGRAVHAALQVLPWDADDATIDALAEAQAVVEAIPDEAATVADLLRGALSMDVAERARTARRAMREVPFAFSSDGILLEGFIDLVIEGQDGSLEVVDWKTDNVAPAAVEQRLRSYHVQAGLYVLGLEAATGRKVERVTYIFVTPGREVSPGAPADMAAVARAAIRGATVQQPQLL